MATELTGRISSIFLIQNDTVWCVDGQKSQVFEVIEKIYEKGVCSIFDHDYNDFSDMFKK